MFLPGTNQVPKQANAALKIVFFELLREHGLIVKEDPPWYSPVMRKPVYQNTTSEAFWDIPIYAEHNEVRAKTDRRATCQPREERSLHN